MQIANGITDVTTYFVLRDSTNHAPKTDVTITDIDLYYIEQGAAMAAKVDATALAAANSAHGDNQAYHVGQGLYRIDWPDAAFDGGVGKVVNLIVVCTGVDTTFLEVELTGVAQTGDAYARIGAPAGASVSADIAAVKTQTGAIETDTQDLQTQIGTDGAGLTAIGDARLANLDATVSSRSTYAGGDTAGTTELLTRIPDATPGTVGGLPLSKDASGRVEVASATDKNTLDALLTSLQGAGWTDETLASLDVLLDAIKAKTDGLPSDPADQSSVEGAITAAAAGLATSAAVAALNDITVADIIAGISEGDLDLQEMLRIILAGVAGKASGGGTTEVSFRDQADTKDRIVMTVDEDGNRTAVTVDGS